MTESFAGGHANFMRNVFTGNTGNPTLFITFGTAYATAPDCLLTGFSATPPYILAVSTTRLAVHAAGKFTYLCEQ